MDLPRTGTGVAVPDPQLTALAESAWFGVMLVRDGRILYANPAAAALIGAPSEHLVGRSMKSVLKPIEPTASAGDTDGLSHGPVHATLTTTHGPPRHVLVGEHENRTDDGVLSTITLVDPTDNDFTRFALQRRWELETALTDVSRHFLSLGNEQFMGGLGVGVGRLGRAVHASRTAILVGPHRAGDLPIALVWESVSDRAIVLPGDASSFDVGAITNRSGSDDIQVHLDAPPPEGIFGPDASDGLTGTTAVVHLRGPSQPLGVFANFWAHRDQPLGDDEIRVLRVSAEILSSTIRRHRAEGELRRQRERVDLAQKAGRSVSWEWYLADDRMVISPSATSLFGISDDQIPHTGAQMWDLVVDEDRERVRGRIRQALENRRPYTVEHRIHVPDRGLRWVSAQGQVITDPQGVATGLVGVSADITDRKLAEMALRTERERAQVTLDCIGDGVIRTDREGTVDFMNPAAEHLTGWKLAEARGRHVSEIYRAEFDGAGRRRQHPVDECLQTGRGIASSDWCSLVRRDEITFAIRDSAAPLIDAKGQAFGAVVIFTDVSHALSLEREMAFLAAHDSLTGLLNRHQFEVALGEALARAKFTGQTHALCFIDLDAFKLVNDACGHAAGDEMLLMIAGALESRIRNEDVLARLGGDEFGLILLDLELDEARDRALQVLESLNDVRFVWDDRVFQVGASIGIVPVGQTSDSLEALLAAADAACYVAKDRGRNQIHVSCPDDQEVAARHREMRWIQRINAAFAENRFRLFSQVIRPIQRPDDPEIVELLLRMVDEDGGIIQPGHFLPAAERYRMMLSVDQWVIHTALDTITTLQKRAEHPTLYALNLSGQSLGDASLLGLIINEFGRSGVDPASVCFEITETAAISNIAAAQSFIDTLAAQGCQFALDDFGSGLSSYRYLRHLSVTYLKIDGNLIRDVSVDPIHREMVSAIHRIGQAMGLRTIGEWVEDSEALEVLRDLGIHYAQGYWIGRPEPVDLSP
jgi:diguanylate cyclase (GGDEF)-like protein/PAS domain S-box-containing protein